jgi:hypothetical protein
MQKPANKMRLLESNKKECTLSEMLDGVVKLGKK